MESKKIALRRQSRESLEGEDVLFTIGIERDELDRKVVSEILQRMSDSGIHGRQEFEDFIRKTDPQFLPELIENTPYQRAYLSGTVKHKIEEPYAWLESMFVKKPFRNRGYATKMMDAMLKEIDKQCYDTHGKVNAHEKVDDFTWELGTGGRSLSRGTNYGIDLSVNEHNERHDRLIQFYKRFGFSVTEESSFFGKKSARIMRPAVCHRPTNELSLR